MRRLRLRTSVFPSFAAILAASVVFAQERPVNGLRRADVRVDAIVGGRVVVAPGQIVDEATVVIRDGVIEAVGANLSIPAEARIRTAAGLTVYPGLIDAAVLVDIPPLPDAPGRHWNSMVHPEARVVGPGAVDPALRASLRSLGFTIAAVHPARGILRGSGSVIALAEAPEHVSLFRARAAMAIGLEADRPSSGEYPGSQMGAIALIRQVLYDAQWHAAARRVYEQHPEGHEPPPPGDALLALDGVLAGEQPVLFETGDELDALRAAKIAREFNLKLMLLGSGSEFRRVEEIAALGTPVILPLAFPEAPDISTIDRAEQITLRELMTWEQAPTNARRLIDAGATIAITTHRLKSREDFYEALRSAIRHGLSEDDALAALTVTPARLLGLDRVTGTIEPGKIANLVLVEGGLFDEEATIRETWVSGRRFEVDPAPAWDLACTGTMRTDLGHELPVTLDTSESSLCLLLPEDLRIDARKVTVLGDQISVIVDGRPFGADGIVRLSGVLTDQAVTGTGALPDGDRFTFTIVPDDGLGEGGEDSRAVGEPAGEEAAAFEPPPEELPSPLGAYGLRQPPRSGPVLIRNATIWTCGPAGILDGADMMVDEGKIVMFGRGLQPALSNTVVVDAGGKHVTPGLIDSHSHTGISGDINEFGQANTAEVCVGDCINPDDIDFYRQLAGGVVAAHLLHGSGNPIGGQNAVVKLKWGGPAEHLLIADAVGSIKFALGENVKSEPDRYPNTRMGVETFIRDAFTAAKEYEAEWDRHLALSDEQQRRTMPPRRDLELDALLEVLRGRRLVHCHSYRQDEILTLIRVAEDFGFTIGTFQHALEGYKVADAIAAHGAGAGGFADWWAYKMEAMDAIPYNGALMARAGVTVAFNSDSSELARRLNTEAAKAVRYGGLDRQEALRLVTINPARHLRIDHRTGSLETGKDADFVIWSDDPLSAYARCEQTWIEGARYFDLQTDRQLREEAITERSRIIQKILAQTHGKTAATSGAEPSD